MAFKDVKELSYEERKIIESLINKNTLTQISRAINRGISTLSAEIKRGGGRENYTADRAQEEANRRKKLRVKASTIFSKRIFTEEELNKIKELYEQGYSISKIRNKMKISYKQCYKCLIDLGLINPIPKPIIENPKNENINFSSFEERISSLESTIEIILNQLRSLKNAVNN